MRRIVPISFLLVAMTVVLAASVVPHHHHGPEGAEHSVGCVVETPFVDRSDRHDKVADCGCPECGDDGHIHLYAVAILCPALFWDEPTTTTDRREPAIRRHPVDLPTGGGLRAPPAPLC